MHKRRKSEQLSMQTLIFYKLRNIQKIRGYSMETTEVLVYEITERVHDITDGTVNVPDITKGV
jgi:hypothetical protein